jgi:hypothetical protein
MTRQAVPNADIRECVEQALQQLAAGVQQSVPSLRLTVQHGQNESFAWWVVARFANAADEQKIVDVSIDCRGTPAAWKIHADVAREDGLVLEEFAPASSDRPEEAANVASVLAQLKGFLSQQVACITRELT